MEFWVVGFCSSCSQKHFVLHWPWQWWRSSAWEWCALGSVGNGALSAVGVGVVVFGDVVVLVGVHVLGAAVGFDPQTSHPPMW